MDKVEEVSTATHAMTQARDGRSPEFFSAFWPDVPDGTLMNVNPLWFSGSAIQIALQDR
jgi:hypothetical protein